MKVEAGDNSMINLSVQQVLSLWAHGTVLRSLTEMWYWVFLWALFSSLFVHGAVGVLMFVMLQRHRQGRLISVIVVSIGFLGSITGAMITSNKAKHRDPDIAEFKLKTTGADEKIQILNTLYLTQKRNVVLVVVTIKLQAFSELGNEMGGTIFIVMVLLNQLLAKAFLSGGQQVSRYSSFSAPIQIPRVCGDTELFLPFSILLLLTTVLRSGKKFSGVKSQRNSYRIPEQVYDRRCIFVEQTPGKCVDGYRVQSLPFAYDTQLAFHKISLSQPRDVDFGNIISDRPYIMLNQIC
ncbi:hypothetical protein TURU_135831 [Turdus rufiventris]|nr:hypothetical protein TURU_135831 [Turdus rufiventris]